MSKKLEDLSASKAGVSQAELESAYAALGTLQQENEEQEALLAKATEAKLKAKKAVAKANANLKKVLATRDPIAEEWARADWVVRNADPDQPQAPMGRQGPRITSSRS